MLSALVVAGIALLSGSLLGGTIVLAKLLQHHSPQPHPVAYDRLSQLFSIIAIAGTALLVTGIGISDGSACGAAR